MPYSKLIEILNKHKLTEVYFGNQGFCICSANEIEGAQFGYSRHPDGSDLTGQDAGDWLSSWVVFGRDESLGDPYFTNLGEPNAPVYTAMHGQGTWDPSQVKSVPVLHHSF